MLPSLLAYSLLAGICLAQSPSDKSALTCTHCDKESFSISEKDGKHFELIVQFSDYRWGVTGTHWYRGNPVLVQYNLSLLRAEHVTYHKRRKTIEARIGVVLEDSSGKQQHFDAVLLKIENGALTPIQLLKDKERSAF